MTYGTEVVIPLEVGLHSLKTSLVDYGANNQALEEALDTVEERKQP